MRDGSIDINSLRNGARTMTQPQPYVPSAREQKFLESVEEGRYERQIISGLGPFFHEKAPEDMLNFYSKDEVTRLKVLKGTDRDVESRMPVKITRHYYELARTSAAIQRIVKADPAETMDLAGSEDPGHQMDYSPVEGLLHKYEMGLMYVVSTCSAHCRFCHREEGSRDDPGDHPLHQTAQRGRGEERWRAPRKRTGEAARDPAFGRRPDGAEQFKDRGLARRAGRSRRRVDSHRHQGDGVLSPALRPHLPVDARSVPRDLPAGRPAHDAALRAPRRVSRQGSGRELHRGRAGLQAMGSRDGSGDARPGLAWLAHRAEPGADHEGHQR